MNSIGSICEKAVAITPEKIFIFVLKNQEITYRDFLESVNKVSNGYLSLGITKGDRKVAVCASKLR